MEPVRNHRNKTVVEAARLHRARARRESGETLLEGPALVADAIHAGGDIRLLFALPADEEAHELARSNRIRLVLVDDRAMKRLAGTETPRGPIAVVQIPSETLADDRNVVVSWGVSDPGNVGTLIRTAASFDWGYAYIEGSADPWSPKTLRAGAGGQFQTAVAAISGLGDLEAWTTLGAVARGGIGPDSVVGDRFAVVIGSEATGLPSPVAAMCDHLVTIATPGATESLNAAVAAGIVVYEISKRSGHEGRSV